MKTFQNPRVEVQPHIFQGQDLGGALLFKERIGFSGTPSDLMPRELGSCDFEPGSEGGRNVFFPRILWAIFFGEMSNLECFWKLFDRCHEVDPTFFDVT